MRAIRRFTVRPVLPEVLKPLGELARNLRWSWHTDTQDLFRSIDPKVWDAAKGDPIRLLADVSVERLQMLAADKKFTKSLRMVTADLEEYLTGDLWYQGYAAETAGRAEGDRLLLAGVRHHRGAAAVLRWARDPGRRPPQGGQ